VGLAGLPGSDEVWVAAAECVWADFGIDGVGPVAVVGYLVGVVGGSHAATISTTKLSERMPNAGVESRRNATERVSARPPFVSPISERTSRT
jgi:hypothetical protein